MDELTARIEKFKRRAPMVDSADHLRKILDTFPEDRRAEILDSVRSLLELSVITEFDKAQ